MTLTIGSLFSGIGGIELGLEWAGLGPTLWQVEIDPACRRVLAKHWPEARRYEDVRDVGAALSRVDLVCGGFPCQDLSSAGQRAGLGGARSGLWHHFARVVEECRPRWVVVENVSSGARNWVDKVRRDLGRLEYASFPIPLAASDCGAPHQRARVFIIGCLAHAHDQEQSPSAGCERRTGEFATARPSLADSDKGRQSQPKGVEREVRQRSANAARWWAIEPDVARVVHGLSGRMDRERAIANSVVPQCAEVVGHVIQQLIRDAAERRLS